MSDLKLPENCIKAVNNEIFYTQESLKIVQKRTIELFVAELGRKSLWMNSEESFGLGVWTAEIYKVANKLLEG